MDHIFAGIEAIGRALEDLSPEEHTRVHHIESALAAILPHETSVEVSAPAPVVVEEMGTVIEREPAIAPHSAIADHRKTVEAIYGELAA